MFGQPLIVIVTLYSPSSSGVTPSKTISAIFPTIPLGPAHSYNAVSTFGTTDSITSSPSQAAFPIGAEEVAIALGKPPEATSIGTSLETSEGQPSTTALTW